VAYKFSPVFIGGSGRSGTTVTLNLLQRHPQFHASLPREIKFLTSRHGLLDLVYTRPFSVEEDLHGYRYNLVTRVLPLLGRNQMTYFTSNLFNRWWSEEGKSGKARGLVQSISLEVVEKAHNEFIQTFAIDRARAAREFFYTLADAQIKKDALYFGDSTPVNMMHADQIHKLLPEARFINVIRDGRDVAVSISKERWGPNNPYEALPWWANRVHRAAVALKSVNPASVLHFRIEDLIVNKREQSYVDLLKFLGLEDSQTLREYFAEQLTAEKLHTGRWRTEVKDSERFNAKYKSLCQSLMAKGIEIKNAD
jgi:hypothetical protein